MKKSSRKTKATSRRALSRARAEALAARAAAKAALAAKHQASYQHAKRLSKRTGRALQEEREGRNLTMYALAQESGVAREMIDRVEQDKSQPTVAWLSRVAFAMGLKLSEFFARLEAEMGKDVAGG